ncbi:MAG: exosortase system-associated protein, TIGR04073 family [Candidatus Omnitrophica bacterium]|nr:exosortase system-associated protein, TIGR04073 family [Candidatus Omnitrophota bacterium]
MKKVFSLVLVLMLLVTQVSYADAGEVVTGMGQKLFRGFVNTFTGFIEFPMQIKKGWDRGFLGDENNRVAGAFLGIFSGLGHAAGRTLSGVGEVVSFWAPDPENNEGIGLPLDAEYAWQEGEAYDIMDPNLAEGLLYPMGRKLFRGLGNAVLAPVEIPGQIIKGIKNRSFDLGILKGLWYTYGRATEGCFDISGFIFPNPVDNKAVAYDEKWPWDALLNSINGYDVSNK